MLQITKTLSNLIAEFLTAELEIYIRIYIYKDLAHIDVIDNHRRGAGGGGLHVGPEWHVHH